MNKKIKKLVFLFISLFILLLAVSIIILINLTKAPSNIKEDVTINIKEGSSHYDIAHLLKENNLIKNEKMFILYTRINKIDNIYAASYKLSTNLNLKELVELLVDGGYNPDQISITFQEGLNIRQIANIIAENTNNTKEDFYNLLKDEAYINELIKKYWFLTEDIKNKDIYYSLEGYLYPDTYSFNNKEVTIKEIIEAMLEQTKEVLDKHKDKIASSNYSIHELITLASVTQSESYGENDFKNVASVFMNRLKVGMKLESCVTSYYGVKKDMTDELYQSDIDDENAYNTRANGVEGLLPVGPVSNPGKNAIDAVINPIDTDYYFFVSDSNNKLYFTKTIDEHERMITKLQNEGLWLEW